MGSKTYDGVWFTCYSHDHPPPHVHARSNGVEVVIDLLPGGKIVRSTRPRPIKPANAQRSEINRILYVAAAHSIELQQLWEKTHGQTS